jgi:hypothetical protein
MTIEVACECGKRFAAPPHLAGKRVKCPSCGLPISVPTQPPATIAVPSASATPDGTGAGNPAPATSINCKCGARLKIKEDLAGRTVKCPKCGDLLGVPAAEQDGVAAQRLGDWFDEQLKDRQPASSAPSSTQEPKPRKPGIPCPRCQEPLAGGFCVACGYEDTTQRYLKVAAVNAGLAERQHNLELFRERHGKASRFQRIIDRSLLLPLLPWLIIRWITRSQTREKRSAMHGLRTAIEREQAQLRDDGSRKSILRRLYAPGWLLSGGLLCLLLLIVVLAVWLLRR